MCAIGSFSNQRKLDWMAATVSRCLLEEYKVSESHQLYLLSQEKKRKRVSKEYSNHIFTDLP